MQLLALKGKESIENRAINLNKESTHHEGSWSNGSDNSCDHVNTAGIIHHFYKFHHQDIAILLYIFQINYLYYVYKHLTTYVDGEESAVG